MFWSLAMTIAHAADGDLPKIAIGGLLFAHYGVDLTSGAEDYNAFDLDRTYLRTEAQLTRRFSVRLTLDSSRETPQTLVLSDSTTVTIPEDPKIRVFVKQAWAQYQPSDALRLRAGAVETCSVPWEEAFEKLRYVAKVPLELAGLQTSADLGITADGKAKDGLLDWSVGAFNGESYGAPEVDAGKTFQGRLAVDPLAGHPTSAPLVVFAEEALHQGGPPRTAVAMLAGVRGPAITATAQLYATSSGGVTGLGASAMAEPRLGKALFLLGRVDHSDPDGTKVKDAVWREWGGVGHAFMDRVELAATYERAELQSAPRVPIQGAFLHGEVGF